MLIVFAINNISDFPAKPDSKLCGVSRLNDLEITPAPHHPGWKEGGCKLRFGMPGRQANN